MLAVAYVASVWARTPVRTAKIWIFLVNNNNNNNTYIALIRMRSKRFTSIVLQYDLEI